jgi:uncharacterized NAD-dependent epimerase/dehydratase family protein
VDCRWWIADYFETFAESDHDSVPVRNQSATRKPQSAMSLRLYVDAMDATVVEVSADGRIRLDNEDWRTPTLQERRAIIYAASNALDDLKELLEILQDEPRA